MNDLEAGHTGLSANMWMRSTSPRWQSLEVGLIVAVAKDLQTPESGRNHLARDERGFLRMPSTRKTARGGPFQNFKFHPRCIT